VAFSVAFVASMGGIVLIFNVLLQAGLGFTPWHAAPAPAPEPAPEPAPDPAPAPAPVTAARSGA